MTSHLTKLIALDRPEIVKFGHELLHKQCQWHGKITVPQVSIKYVLVLLLLGGAWVTLSMMSLLKTVKVQKRFAFLRRNPEQVPVSSEQPLPLLLLKGKQTPFFLIKQLSRKAHLILLAVGFGILVLITLIVFVPTGISASGISVTQWEILGFWSAYWCVLQGGLTLVFYQRVEVSESGLVVQRGVIRRRIGSVAKNLGEIRWT